MGLTSFAQNPLIASLGNAVGLGGVLNAAPAAATPHLASKPNMPEYREARPYIPYNMNKSGAIARPLAPAAVPGGVMDEDTLQSPNVHDLLATFGVSAPEGIDQHLFIHDPQAFVKHPLIAGMLERGLEGLAYAQPGQNFFQSLMGGVRGMQDARAANIANMNAQTLAPIEQANAVASLQQKKQALDLGQAQQTYDQSRARYYDDLYNNKSQYETQIGKLRKQLQDSHNAVIMAGQDPLKVLQNTIINQREQETANKLYGGNKTKLTSTDLQSIYQGLLGNVKSGSVAQAAGKVKVKQTVGGGTNSPNGPKMSKGDQLDWQQTSGQIRDLQKQLADIKSGRISPFLNNGNLVDPQAVAQQITTLQQHQNALIAKYGGRQSSSAATAPRKYSPNNPFAK